jgi:amino acid transporter
MRSLIGLAYAMGLILSPEALILLGNTLGQSSLTLVVSGLVLAGSLYSLTALMYGRCGNAVPVYSGEAQLLLGTWGPVLATVLPLCARGVYTICAATGMLAIAGYVFNEVFVSWFPNLGFSFVMLGVIVVLNLFPPKIATAVQLLAVALVLGGILWLASTALGGAGQQVVPMLPGTGPVTLGPGRSFLAGLVLLMGVELALFAPSMPSGARPTSVRPMVLALGLAVLLFWLWGWASLTAVAPARLAESTVPHMVTARALLGAHGRMIMGLVVLAGTCGAVNALLGGGARMLVGMGQQRLVPTWLSVGQGRPALLLLALEPAAMLGLGMAGEPETEVYTRAGVLFWMLLYAVGHLAVLFHPQQGACQPDATPGPGRTVRSWLSVCLLSASLVGLLWHEPHPRHLLRFMGLVGLAMTGLSVLWWGYGRCQRRRHIPDVTLPHHVPHGAGAPPKGEDA